jgi:hypothetical protein
MEMSFLKKKLSQDFFCIFLGRSIPSDPKHDSGYGPDWIRGSLPDLMRGRAGPDEEAEGHPHVLTQAFRV